MSEVTDLVVIEKSNAMAVFTSKEQLDPLLEKIETEARSLVPDLTTKKGRDAIASMAHKVARSKTYIDNAGKDLVAELKALPKQIDESRRIVRERLDALKDEVRRPLTEWEAEQERLKQEEEARLAAEAYALMREEADSMNDAFDVAKAEALRKQIATDHEMALLMNDAFDRAAAEEAAEKERKRIEYEAELTRLAENAARRAVEVKAEQDRLEAAHREYVLKSQAEQAERDRIDAEQKAEADKKAAFERAEREKQEAIAAEQRKAQEEAARIKREADQREAARLAEEKRIADELEARQADVNHRKTVGTAIVNALTAHTSITREQAIEVLTVLKDDLIPRVEINY